MLGLLPPASTLVIYCRRLAQVLPVASTRFYTAGTATKKVEDQKVRTVKLTFDIFDDKKADGPKQPAPLIILHGLFGHRGNFRSVAKTLNEKTSRKVVTVDSRNHGASERSEEMNFIIMAEDVVELLKELSIEKPAVMGHSMGGRTAMTMALIYPKLVEKLIVEDVAPRKSRSSLESIPLYLKAMKAVKFDESKSLADTRLQVSDDLKKTIPDKEVRSFIVNNLVDVSEKTKKIEWMFDVGTIAAKIRHLERMPDFNRAYHTDALFIGGTRSMGLTRADQQEIHRLFPRSITKYVEGAGHWVHVDKPERFEKYVVDFLNAPTYNPSTREYDD